MDPIREWINTNLIEFIKNELSGNGNDDSTTQICRSKAAIDFAEKLDVDVERASDILDAWIGDCDA